MHVTTFQGWATLDLHASVFTECLKMSLSLQGVLQYVSVSTGCVKYVSLSLQVTG